MKRKTSGRGRVIRYYRGARRHPRWDLGTPPGGPRRSLKGRLGLLMAGLTLGAVLLPPVVDAVNGLVKPADGCRVVQVIDGDTVRLLCPSRGVITGRVIGYDTPELRARCLREFVDAQKATAMLRWILWSGSEISVRTEGQDRYGRALTVLLVDGHGVARRMVDAGLARWYDGGRRTGWCADGFGGFDV